MAAPRNALKVGVMTVFCVVAALAILLWLSKGIGSDTRKLMINFKSDSSMPTLSKGSPVLVGGQKVGTVLKAELINNRDAKPDAPPSEAYIVAVETEILDYIELRKDCHVFAEGPPLGGDGLIKIDLGKDEHILPHDVVVQGAAPAGFATIINTIQTEFNADDPTSLIARIKIQLDPGARESVMNRLLLSMKDLNDMTASLNTQLDREKVDSLLAKLHTTADNLNSTTAELRDDLNPDKSTGLMGKVHAAIDSVNSSLQTVNRVIAANEGPINTTVGHVASTAEKLDTRIIENVAAQTDPKNVDGLISRINKAAAQLNQSLADINSVTGAARDVIALNRDNINKMLINFKETSEHLKSAAKYVLERPWRLLNAPTKTEDHQYAIFDAARNFAEAANRLDDASAQLRALSELHKGSIPFDDKDLARIRTDLESTQARFKKAEEKLWHELDVK